MGGAQDAQFAQFVDTELTRLLNLAFALTGDHHDAWDLTQETFARIGARWDRLKDSNPGGYAHTVLVRLNVDRIRRMRREALGVIVERPAPPVESVAEVDEFFLSVLATLSPSQRTAVVLRYLGDRDLQGIADEMGCSLGTAKSHLSRGTARIRERLAPAAGGEVT
ncbi:MAG: SigE family RNA polymerase sigma factor [Actinomycetales bacterium]|nr:SigE family RNA polymerase sigma factor [Actinomycetales bacterium]